MMSMKPAIWLEGRICEHRLLPCFFRNPFACFLPFCHALQNPDVAAVFSPSPGVCLLLLIWGIAPGIELHRFRHRSQKFLCRRHAGLQSSPYLLLAAFPCRSAHWRRHGKMKACTMLRRVWLFKAPYRSPQEIAHSWKWRRTNWIQHLHIPSFDPCSHEKTTAGHHSVRGSMTLAESNTTRPQCSEQRAEPFPARGHQATWCSPTRWRWKASP